MTHDDFREMIQRELDEDLSPEESKLLEAHVITCAACRKEREEYQKLANGLARLSKVMPERSFVSQMMSDLPNLPKPEAQKESSGPAPIKKRKASYWMRGLSAAAVVVLAVGFTTHWKFTFGGLNGTSVQVADNRGTGQSPGQSGDSQTGQTSTTNPADTQTKTPATPGHNTLTNEDSTPKTDTHSNQDQQAPAIVSHPLLADSVQESKTLREAPNLPKSETIDPNKSQTQTLAPASPPDHQPVDMGSTAGSVVGLGGDDNGQPPAKTETGAGSNTSAGKGGPIKSHANGLGGSAGTSSGSQGLTAPGGGSDASAAPLTIVGPVQNPPADLNPQLQANVKSGQSTWATDPTEVVERHLTALGFSQTADVLSTPKPGRVQVMQGETFMVTLTQPYEQDSQGIWVPAQISRLVNQQNPVQPDKPIVQYFNQLKTAGTIVDVGQLEILQDTSNQVVVSANVVQKNKAGKNMVTQKLYVCPVTQQADGTWVLNGTPQVK